MCSMCTMGTGHAAIEGAGTPTPPGQRSCWLFDSVKLIQPSTLLPLLCAVLGVVSCYSHTHTRVLEDHNTTNVIVTVLPEGWL